MRSRTSRILAILSIAFALIAVVGFFSIAASTVGGDQGNRYLLAGIAGIAVVVIGATLTVRSVIRANGRS